MNRDARALRSTELMKFRWDLAAMANYDTALDARIFIVQQNFY
jgi:hypothetical protein